MKHQPVKCVKLSFRHSGLAALQEEAHEYQNDASHRVEERCSLTLGKWRDRLIPAGELRKVGQPVGLFLAIADIPFDQVDEKILNLRSKRSLTEMGEMLLSREYRAD